MKRSERSTISLLVWMLTVGMCCGVNGSKASEAGSSTSVRFAVMSDPHLYQDRLGTSGSAFEAYLNYDPKLLKESEAILDSALQRILQEQVQFLIIPGDLTKDGELVDHVLMAQYLAKVQQHGIQVFVVPGNHDIQNTDAISYAEDGATRPVPNVSPAVFSALYERFGYGQAIARDVGSLSYVAEPVAGLWLLGIDACKYRENEQAGTPVVSGRLSPETLSWVVSKVQEGQALGKQVIAFMHHGVNEHFLSEPLIFREFLVDDWPTVSAQLAAAGLKVIFTGHYHSQDAANDTNGWPTRTLCDVETGSLIQYPCAFRIVTLDGAMLKIESRRVTEICADTGGLPFQQYAEAVLRVRLRVRVIHDLMLLFGLPEAQAAQVAPLVVDALVANYAGDESPSAQTLATVGGLIASPEPMHTLGLLLYGIWIDLPPNDNELVVPIGL